TSYPCFLLALRRPPTSTLFPYTTLFRSVDSVSLWALDGTPLTTPSAYSISGRVAVRTDQTTGFDFAFNITPSGEAVLLPTGALRSEEHTSEPQSRFDLVCRLLLEKKNYYVFLQLRQAIIDTRFDAFERLCQLLPLRFGRIATALTAALKLLTHYPFSSLLRPLQRL